MITKEQIAAAKKVVDYDYNDKLHEHDDCIRIAYEWLDAQRKTKGQLKKSYQIKHLVEDWGGRYVSTADVVVAAQLHPQISGKYPHYNISSSLTEPSAKRLTAIGESYKHKDKRGRHKASNYKYHE